VPLGYIRPLAYYGYGSMKLIPPSNLPIDVIIACWPWGDYLPVNNVDVVTSPYIRIHPKSTTVDAKLSGHYVNGILAGLAIRNTRYHEALLLDSDGFVAEGTGENIFIIKNGEIITTPCGTILPGITRAFVIQIAKELGISIIEDYFKPKDVYTADEAFFSGTAVEITPIRSLDDQLIAQGKIGEMTQKIQQLFHQIVRGEVPEFHNALTWINVVEKAVL
jgi:branched-chain amino acid aminotransferase